MDIRKIARYSDIMFWFPPKIRFFAEMKAENGLVFAAFEGDEPLGVVCLRRHTRALDVSYLYVREAYRCTGIALCLMRHAALAAQSVDCALSFRVLQNGAYVQACEKIADTLHLQFFRETIFFGIEVNEASCRLWMDARPQLVQTLSRLERRIGRQRVLSFADADEGLLDRLRDEIGRSLPGGLNPFALPDFNLALSTIVLRECDDDIVGFYAVRTIGKKMIHEISATKHGQTLIAAVPGYFDTLFASDIEKVTCAVYGDNVAGLNHVHGRFGFLFKERNRQRTYMLKEEAAYER